MLVKIWGTHPAYFAVERLLAIVASDAQQSIDNLLVALGASEVHATRDMGPLRRQKHIK
jgi:hypothetical protein